MVDPEGQAFRYMRDNVGVSSDFSGGSKDQ